MADQDPTRGVRGSDQHSFEYLASGLVRRADVPLAGDIGERDRRCHCRCGRRSIDGSSISGSSVLGLGAARKDGRAPESGEASHPTCRVRDRALRRSIDGGAAANIRLLSAEGKAPVMAPGPHCWARVPRRLAWKRPASPRTGWPCSTSIWRARRHCGATSGLRCRAKYSTGLSASWSSGC